MRSIYCGQVNEAHAGQTITLCGWVHRRRDLGGLIFIDMRDREGIVQVFFDPDKPDAFALASELRGEFCIQVTGVVRTRPDSQRNSDMATGAIEVSITLLKLARHTLRPSIKPTDSTLLAGQASANTATLSGARTASMCTPCTGRFFSRFRCSATEAK